MTHRSNAVLCKAFFLRSSFSLHSSCIRGYKNNIEHVRTSSSLSSSSTSRATNENNGKNRENNEHEMREDSNLDIKCRPDTYEIELEEKIEKALSSMNEKAKISLMRRDVEIFGSRQQAGGFRMRAVFGIHHDGPIESRYCMTEVLSTKVLESGKVFKEKRIVFVDEFPMGSEAMKELMPTVRELIERDDENMRKRLFQCEFLTATTGDVVLTMCYHRTLDEKWEIAARKMRDEINERHKDLNVSIVGRANKIRKVVGDAFVNEIVKIDDDGDVKVLKYKQLEGQFAQPNAEIATEMIKFAQSCSRNDSFDTLKTDFLELYCGNGHFSVALAPMFRTCLSTEISKTNIAAARENIDQNNIENTFIVRLSAEEVVQAIDGTREFTRLKACDLDFSKLDIKTVLVDPPRAGCGKDVSKMLQRFDRIIYISCNAETLANDLKILCETHEITRFAIFDQFPYTPHLECGALLVRSS